MRENLFRKPFLGAESGNKVLITTRLEAVERQVGTLDLSSCGTDNGPGRFLLVPL